jgi:L-iditol 2-dehydrogenase
LEDYGNSMTCAEPPHLLGGWAELMYLRPGTRVFHVPDELDSRLAAMTELLSVTHGLDRFMRAGDTVLVIGAGPLGMVHLIKADLLGAGRLVAVDLLPERLDVARACGADAVEPEPADVVVDCSGRSDTLPDALKLVRPGGVVIEAGAFVDMGPVEIDPNRDICVRDVTIRGIGGEDLAHYAPSLRLLARHPDRFAPLITHRVGLEEVGDALELAQTGAAMKVLVAPNGE